MIIIIIGSMSKHRLIHHSRSMSGQTVSEMQPSEQLSMKTKSTNLAVYGRPME